MENIRSLNILAENMRKLRKIKRLTQDELAYRAGLHTYSIGLIERKIKSPSLRSVEKIANALNVSVSELVDERRHAKIMKDAREQEIAQVIRRLNEKQADVLLGIIKSVVEEFAGAKQISKPRVTKQESLQVVKRPSKKKSLH